MASYDQDFIIGTVLDEVFADFGGTTQENIYLFSFDSFFQAIL